MNILVDIDDTLLLYPDSHLPPWERGGKERYENAVPNTEEIKRINRLYKLNRITIYTGRGWEQYDITVAQLKKFGIKFDQLIMGKPQGIYIDADNFKTAKEVEDVFHGHS
jgi:hypothetical protein